MFTLPIANANRLKAMRCYASSLLLATFHVCLITHRFLHSGGPLLTVTFIRTCSYDDMKRLCQMGNNDWIALPLLSVTDRYIQEDLYDDVKRLCQMGNKYAYAYLLGHDWVSKGSNGSNGVRSHGGKVRWVRGVTGVTV